MKTLFLAAMVAGAATGCSIASGTFVFEDLSYPASMSPFVGGPDGATVNKKDLRTVGKLEYEKDFWSIAYGLIAFTGDSEAGAELDLQLKEKGGDAVINLRASAEPCGINNTFFLNWWPIWPACVHGRLDGEIVKYTAPVASAPAVPAPAPAPAAPAVPAAEPAPLPASPPAETTPGPAGSRVIPRERVALAAKMLFEQRLAELSAAEGGS